MIERPMPQDILKFESKVIANFSARQALFGGIGCVVTIYFAMSVFKDVEDTSMRALLSALPAIPFFLIGFVKLYGVYFEKIIVSLFLDNFVYPMKRKKEVHYPEMEKYERSRYWMKDSTKKIKCKKSKQYKGIK